MKKFFKNCSKKDIPARIILFILMWLFALTFVYMYVWLLFNSFRKPMDFNLDTFRVFDFANYTRENWKYLFTVQIAGTARDPVYIYDTVLNTIVLVALQILLGITIPALTGYIFAKYRFKGRNLLFNVMVVSMIVPTVGSLATTYRLMQDVLHLTNSLFGIAVMSAGGFGFSFLLFRNYFSAIPWEYAESAYIDAWNDYMTAYIYLPQRPTIALGVYQLFTKMSAQLLVPVALAGMAFMATVSLIIYACFNKVIMSSVSAGGLKG